eukprot:403342377
MSQNQDQESQSKIPHTHNHEHQDIYKPPRKVSVLGICQEPDMRRYVLWTLKLMKDVPTIYDKISFQNVSKDPSKVSDNLKNLKELEKYDVVISDVKIPWIVDNLKPDCIYGVLNSDDKLMAEHEYLAKSGFLSFVGMAHFQLGRFKRPQSLPQQPTTKLMFYYVYSLMLFTKIQLHLTQRQQSLSNLTQPQEPTFEKIVLENHPTDNLLYISQFVLTMKNMNMWNQEQGQNLLDGGAPFYTIYQSKDKKYFAVGCIEPQFFKIFLKGLPIDDDERKYLKENQSNMEEWPKMKEKLQKIFKTQPSKFWKQQFKNTDACVTMVLNDNQAMKKKIFKQVTQKPKKNDHIMNLLQKEINLKDHITITPLAKL